MDNHRYSSLFLLLLLMFIISSHYTTAIGTVQEEEEQQKTRAPIIETVKRMVSFPTTLPQTSTSWNKLESLITQGKAYFSPPSLDFRDSGQEAQAKDEAAAGEKVKEAVLKSFDKSKATMEDTAKSAAKLAGDAMHKTTDKAKRTFSFGDRKKDSRQQEEEEL